MPKGGNMGKLLLTGVDGNLGSEAARVLLTLANKEDLIFVGYSKEALDKFAAQGVETRQANFNEYEGLEEAFAGAERLALISMPFVGAKRQKAQKNVVDAAKAKNIPIRVGVNSGSLEKDIVAKYSGVTAEGLVESALDKVRIIEDLGYDSRTRSGSTKYV